MDVNSSPRTPYNTNLITGNPSDDLNMGVNVDNGYTAFDMNALTQDPEDNFNTNNTNTGPHSLCTLSQGDPSSFDMNFYPNDFTSASLTPQFELSGVNTNQPILRPSHLLVDDEEESDFGLPGPLGDLLEDANILDEMSLLDLALEEGFSRDMAARLEEEGYLVPEQANRNTGLHNTAMTDNEEDDGGTSCSTMAQRNSRTLRQGNLQICLLTDYNSIE